jgi:hypothetical protein
MLDAIFCKRRKKYFFHFTTDVWRLIETLQSTVANIKPEGNAGKDVIEEFFFCYQKST